MKDITYVIEELDKIIQNPEFHPKSYSIIEPRDQSSKSIMSETGLTSTQEVDSDEEEEKALLGNVGLNNSQRQNTLDKMKGKKKRRSRPVEESKESRKKSIKKSIKGTLMATNGTKKLGANEDDGEYIAFEERKDYIEETREKQK